MGNIKQKHNMSKQNKVMDTNDRIAVTTGWDEWGQDEEGKEGQTYGERKRLDFGWWATMEYKDYVL